MKRRGFFAWAVGGIAAMVGMRKAPANERDRTADFQMAVDLAKRCEDENISVRIMIDPESGLKIIPDSKEEMQRQIDEHLQDCIAFWLPPLPKKIV